MKCVDWPRSAVATAPKSHHGWQMDAQGRGRGCQLELELMLGSFGPLMAGGRLSAGEGYRHDCGGSLALSSFPTNGIVSASPEKPGLAADLKETDLLM